MASSSSSSPACSSQSWNYDVFLSFRGEDTRKNFVDHLYKALVLQGIETYKDDETLRRGETIGRALMKAIEESQIAIIIFSKNYADSSWCLDELVHIMECRKTRGQLVMPVFYGVEPSEVRKQTKIYGEAFLKYKLEKKNRVESWKRALEDADNISGWEPTNVANGHEAKIIKEIVDKILPRIKQVTSSADEKLVGMQTRLRRLKSELQIGAGGVRMIGIWGVGGGGKTTLASCIYDEICRKFDGCCFIANIREESERHGLEKLVTKILLKMGTSTTGSERCLIAKRLHNRKVLIVLDDVNRRDQLEELAGSPNWFGEGSRIIITTRDQHLLNAHKVVVHDISLLGNNEATELFCKHATQGSIPTEEYKLLSKEVVSYAGGLPLALTVLGSSLCDKNIAEWRSALARLKKIPDTEILEKLKLSFDGLTDVQKDLFLDIACLYGSGVRINLVMETLDACGFDPVIGVKELSQKALITISDGYLNMHDLVREMGHHIVRGEHPKNPEKHSRVWMDEDILKLCAMDATMELDKIEAIRGDFIGLPIVANMRNLRHIHWIGNNPWANNFPQMKLCCLILFGSLQDQLWTGYKYLPNLKIMYLWRLKNLIVTPNFDGIPNLERFWLSGSSKLKEVHSSFGGLERLISLRIDSCSGIKKFPSITRLKKLEILSFEECPRVFELSEIQQKTNNLEAEDMSSAIRELSKLYHIRLYFYRRDLRKLNLRNCNLGDESTRSVVWEFPNLQVLDLRQDNFSQLNFSLIRTPQLKFLYVPRCSMLKEISGLPPSICVLGANDCKSLTTIGDISSCKWLWNVSLFGTRRVDVCVGQMLIDSMLEGNAIEQDHFISVALHPKIHVRSLNTWFKGNACTLHLPHDWHNDFCGFLIHVVTGTGALLPEINVIMKQEVDEESPFELWRESDEELEHKYIPSMTCVGYVSFNSLRRTASLNSRYKVISIFEDRKESRHKGKIGVQLVPRKSKDDLVQTTKATTGDSEFWDEDDADYIYNMYRAFTIKPSSQSSIKILWKPYIL